ncbi:MAG TPA: HDOD domain-containing protein [Opitutus sp.]|nr:HDOD domain-containing protein [Opitutus sp.]
MTDSAVPPTVEQVCAQALRMPCSPALLPRLAAALRREDSSAADIEEIIELDPPLAAATLRVANSVFFGATSSTRVGTVAGAVLRLGQREVYRLAALVLVERWEQLTPLGLSWEPGDFCRHALCTGLAAEVLAEKTGLVEPATAYTAGLLCDLGKLALAYACARHFPAIRSRCREARVSWEQAETDILGYNHADVGGRLLREWRFPDELVAAAGFQVDPRSAPAEATPLLAHLHAAKYLATTLGPGVAEDGFLFALHGTFLIEWGFTPELLEEALPVVLDRATKCLGERLSHGPVELN